MPAPAAGALALAPVPVLQLYIELQLLAAAAAELHLQQQTLLPSAQQEHGESAAAASSWLTGQLQRYLQQQGSSAVGHLEHSRQLNMHTASPQSIERKQIDARQQSRRAPGGAVPPVDPLLLKAPLKFAAMRLICCNFHLQVLITQHSHSSSQASLQQVVQQSGGLLLHSLAAPVRLLQALQKHQPHDQEYKVYWGPDSIVARRQLLVLASLSCGDGMGSLSFAPHGIPVLESPPVLDPPTVLAMLTQSTCGLLGICDSKTMVVQQL